MSQMVSQDQDMSGELQKALQSFRLAPEVNSNHKHDLSLEAKEALTSVKTKNVTNVFILNTSSLSMCIEKKLAFSNANFASCLFPNLARQ